MKEEYFVNLVKSVIAKRNPDLNVQEAGNGGLLINGRRIDIDNLYRICKIDSDTADIEDKIMIFINNLTNTEISIDDTRWEDVCKSVMPRIQPNTVWNSLDPNMAAHTPWVNDCSIMYVIDYPDMTVSITTDQMRKWKMTEEDFFHIAKDNLEQQTVYEENIRVSRADRTVFMIYQSQDGYDSSRILLDSLWHRASDYLGFQFYACIPSRDVLAMCTMHDNGLIRSWMRKNKATFNDIPYPITPHPFVVTLDGVASYKPWK